MEAQPERSVRAGLRERVSRVAGTAIEWMLGDPVTADRFVSLCEDGCLRVPDALAQRLEAARAVVDAFVHDGARPVYGLNTGVGSLKEVRLAGADLGEFNARLIRDHAVAVGEEAEARLARATLLARICALAQGGSGISLRVFAALVDLFNAGVTPVVHLRGSVGEADLGALADIAQVLLGRGEAWVNGRRLGGADALAVCGLLPVTLGPRDALALIGANSLAAAAASLAVVQCRREMRRAEEVAAFSFVAYRAHAGALQDEALRAHGVRAQTVGSRMQGWLAGWRESPRSIQDPLSFRCLPQVHGGVELGCELVTEAAQAQWNRALDNPLVIPETGDILSNGNFDATELALACDALKNAIGRALALSERRIGKLLDGRFSGLATGLAEKPGESGFDILHHTALGLAGDAAGLAQPTFAQPGSAAQGVEDYGSMATAAALAIGRLLPLWRWMIAVEAAVACRAARLRGATVPGPLAALEDLAAKAKRDDASPADIVRALHAALFGSPA